MKGRSDAALFYDAVMSCHSCYRRMHQTKSAPEAVLHGADDREKTLSAEEVNYFLAAAFFLAGAFFFAAAFFGAAFLAAFLAGAFFFLAAFLAAILYSPRGYGCYAPQRRLYCRDTIAVHD